MKKTEYICDDRRKPVSPEVAKMSDAEVEKEFQRLFGDFVQNENDETA